MQLKLRMLSLPIMGGYIYRWTMVFQPIRSPNLLRRTEKLDIKLLVCENGDQLVM